LHGNITERAHEVCRLVSYADSAKVTDNLWGERWSKLVANTMANGVSACTGLPGAQLAQNEAIRHFQARLGSEAIRIGQARGYRLEEIDHLPPETIARASDIDVMWLNGFGFPRYRGGLMYWADGIGVAEVDRQIQAWHQQYGERWAPAALLRRLADTGTPFPAKPNPAARCKGWISNVGRKSGSAFRSFDPGCSPRAEYAALFRPTVTPFGEAKPGAGG
jgi:hypothetical protein